MYQFTNFVDNCRVRFHKESGNIIIQFEDCNEAYCYSFPNFKDKQPNIVSFSEEYVSLIYEYSDKTNIIFFNIGMITKEKIFKFIEISSNLIKDIGDTLGFPVHMRIPRNKINSYESLAEVFPNQKAKSIFNRTYYLNSEGRLFYFKYQPIFTFQELTVPIKVQFLVSGCEFIVAVGKFNDRIYFYSHGSGQHGCLGVDKKNSDKIEEVFNIPSSTFDRIECTDFGVKIFLNGINSIFVWGWNKDFQLSTSLDENVVLYTPTEIDIDD
uniref:Regulator of chromosome condensation domain-containing protein n=1 Tax=Parastrongyloides trichosuri TaxID=131310 RepID=A0A0N4ZFK6_PARTI